MRIFRYFLLGLVLVIMAGCSGTAVSTPTVTTEPTAVVIIQPTNQPIDTPALSEAEVAVPATEPPPATATTQPTPTNTAVPTESSTDSPEIAETAVATETATSMATAETEAGTVVPPTNPPPPPSTTGVEQPPYEASSCSDKYPCNDDRAAWEARIRVPAGFTDTYFARINGAPTSLTFGPDAVRCGPNRHDLPSGQCRQRLRLCHRLQFPHRPRFPTGNQRPVRFRSVE